jgi:hypothetical protein
MSRPHLKIRVVSDREVWTLREYWRHITTKNRTSRWLIVLGGLSIVGVAVAFVVLHSHHANTPAASGLAEEQAVAAKVSKHYILPTNETPALATVTDSKKLNTPFLKNAKDGDEILIYQKNRIVIIYRPGVDRIVGVGPVTIDTPPTPGNNQSQTFPPTTGP